MTVENSNSEAAIDRRRYRRTAVLWSARLATGAREIECAILNVSAGGAKIRIREHVRLHTPVTLNIDRFGDFRGEGVWRHDRELGIRFSEEAPWVAAVLGRTLPSCQTEIATL